MKANATTSLQTEVPTLHLNSGSMRQHAQILKQTSLDLVQVFVSVLVGHVGRADV